MASSQGNSILLVDDTDINQELGKILLECNGYEVTIACDGSDALKKLESDKYDLILMDCLMPEMDGFTASKHIRDSEGDSAHIPIIALTACTLQETKDKCKEAGMDDFLAKPFEEEELMEKVKTWLKD